MRDPDRVVILNDLSAVRGGAAFLATTLARAVRARGPAVTFIAGDRGEEPVGDGIEVVALGGQPLIEDRRAAVLKGLYDPSMRRRVGAWIEAHDTPGTVYHLHNWAGILTPAVFDALAGVAHRTVVHAHDFFLACPNGAFLDYPRAEVCGRTPLSLGCLATQCDKRAYGHKLWRATRNGILVSRLGPMLREARFVMIHEAMRPWLNRIVRPRHLIAIGNPAEAFGPVVTAPEANGRIVHIGQVQRLKGVFELAEAGRRLGRRVDFVGAGESLDELRALYPEHAYHGWMARDAIGRLLAEARVAVVATQSPEPFCLAAFESLATGLPLIVSDSILPARELVESGAAVPFWGGSIESLTGALGQVLGDDVLAARLGRAARLRGAALASSPADWADHHYRLYCSLATDGGGRTNEDRSRRMPAIREPV